MPETTTDREALDAARIQALADVFAWVDEQRAALPERRTDAAHGKAELLREFDRCFRPVEGR